MEWKANQLARDHSIVEALGDQKIDLILLDLAAAHVVGHDVSENLRTLRGQQT